MILHDLVTFRLPPYPLDDALTLPLLVLLLLAFSQTVSAFNEARVCAPGLSAPWRNSYAYPIFTKSSTLRMALLVSLGAPDKAPKANALSPVVSLLRWEATGAHLEIGGVPMLAQSTSLHNHVLHHLAGRSCNYFKDVIK